MNNRLTTLRNFLQKKKLDAIFITHPSNLFYFSGFQALTFTEREAYVFVSMSHSYLLTNQLYIDDAKKTVPNDFQVIEITADVSLTKRLEEIFHQEKLQVVGFEEHNLTYFEYQKLSKKIPHIIPASIDDLRIVKDTSEIDSIAQACSIGDRVFDFILGKIKPGMTEEEVAFEMEIYMRQLHAVPSFPTIVAFGPNASVPHHMPGKQELEVNNFVLLDFGVRVHNYCSDMTRTIFIGKPTREQKKVYDTVLQSQKKAIGRLKEKKGTDTIIAKDIDATARNYITAKGYPSFPHSLGHGIGIDVHEGVRISPFSDMILENNMVFSIEPGIYIPNDIGVRIEDLVVLEKDNVHILTNAPKELIII